MLIFRGKEAKEVDQFKSFIIRSHQQLQFYTKFEG